MAAAFMRLSFPSECCRQRERVCVCVCVRECVCVCVCERERDFQELRGPMLTGISFCRPLLGSYLTALVSHHPATHVTHLSVKLLGVCVCVCV